MQSTSAESDGAALSQSEIEQWRAELRERLEGGKLELPPFPEVAQQVLSLASDEATGGRELADLVHRDQGLATKILRISNSALYGTRVRIVSLQQAVSHLGINRVFEVAVAAAIRDGVFDQKRYKAELNELWRGSLASALYAKAIARQLRQNVESAFLCCLLARIGEVLVIRALVASAPEADAPLGTADLETLTSEFAPAYAAAAVQAWSLPAPVAAVAAGGIDDGGSEGAFAGHIAIEMLARELAQTALSDEAEAIDEPDGSAECVNAATLHEFDPALLAQLDLYPASVEALLAQGSEIRAVVEAV